MSLSQSYARIRSGIVAFVPRYPEKLRTGSRKIEFVFGTGFVVGDSLIATNAHIVDVFNQFPAQDSGQFDVSVMLFIRSPLGMATVAVNVMKSCIISGIRGQGIYYGPSSADLGLVAVDCKGLAKYAMKLNTNCVEEGELVATSGFPMGSTLLDLEGQLDHISPTLQSGVISAVLPFATTNPHGYLANIMVQGGASGSPVFMPESGEVIGVVCQQRLDASEVTMNLPEPIKVPVPVNFSHIVPSHFLHTLIAEATDELMRHVPEDAPRIDEILSKMPEQVPSGASQKPHTFAYHRNEKNSGNGTPDIP